MEFTYNGVTYKTLSDAATKLNLSQTYLSVLKKKQKYTDAEAVNHALKAKDEEHMRGNKLECVVFGRQYPSISNACRVYKIPYVSVRSRMYRHGETVEEAIAVLLKGKDTTTEQEIFSKSELKLEEEFSIEELPSTVDGLIKKLTSRGYEPKLFSFRNLSIPVIGIKKPFPDSSEGNLWIVIGEAQTQLIVTDFSATVKADNKLELLEKMNTVNSCSWGARVWLAENKTSGQSEIMAGYSIPQPGKYETPVMTVLKYIEIIFKFCIENVGKLK